MADLTLKIKADFDEASRQFQELGNESAAAKAKIDKFTKAFEEESTDRFIAKQRLAGIAITATSGDMAAMIAQQKAYKYEIERLIKGGLDPQSAAVQKLQREYVELGQKMEGAKKTNTSVMSAFRDMQAIMQGPVAAFNAVKGAITQVYAVLDDLENQWTVQEKAIRLMDSTLEATGATAWTTREEILALSEELEAMSGVGKENIRTMQTVLLGFKNIKGDNFKDASVQIMNMATVMGMDLTGAAQAVGKALDDPIAGINSLVRQGFRFSESQKTMLAEMVNTGKIAEAQKIILDELATTYGGAAAAAGSTATAIKVKLGAAIDGNNEQTGRYIAESLKPMREWLLSIAEANETALTAYNDYREALAKEKGGTATAADELLILKTKVQAQKDYIAQLDSTGMTQNKNAEKELSSLENQLKIKQAQVDYESKMAKIRQEALNAGTKSEKEAADRKAAQLEKEKAAQDALNERYKASRDLVTSSLDSQKTKYQEIQEKINQLESTPWASGEMEKQRLEAIAILHQEQYEVLLEESNKRLELNQTELDAQLAATDANNKALVASEKAAADAKRAIKEKELQIYAGFFGSMSSLLSAAAGENEAAATAIKVLSAAQAGINSYLAFTQMIADPFYVGRPWMRAVSGASILASGLAAQAQIWNTKTSAETGGRFTVPDVSGGPDSAVMRVNPGETVDVQSRSATTTGGGTQNIVVQLDTAVLFTAINRGIMSGDIRITNKNIQGAA